MAVLCVSNALGGGAIGLVLGAIGLGLAGLSTVQGGMRAHINGGSDGLVRHCRRRGRRGHGCCRSVVDTGSWLLQLREEVGVSRRGRGINDARKRRLGKGKGRRKQLLGREPWAKEERRDAVHGAGPAGAATKIRRKGCFC
jgi:hypothetical protein